VSFYNGRKPQALAYTEKKTKRLVGHVMDKVKVKIMEAHKNRSMSPDRRNVE
jgi:hypothetical protein